jgi:hypothetical protein
MTAGLAELTHRLSSRPLNNNNPPILSNQKRLIFRKGVCNAIKS